jgi:hypothetical protein
MSEFFDRIVWKEMWSNMRTDPFPYIIVYSIFFILGIFITTIVFEHVFIAGKDSVIHNLEIVRDSYKDQRDDAIREKKKLESYPNKQNTNEFSKQNLITAGA